ncbi:MAG: hypothetical protein ACTSXZ_10595 [Alphaproteobacteria bacterium]
MHVAFRGRFTGVSPSSRAKIFGFGARVYVPVRRAIGRIKARRPGVGGAWIYSVEFAGGGREEFPNSALLPAQPGADRRRHIELVVDNCTAARRGGD